jgi:CRISPR type IV-associated protein Csf3
MKPLKITFHLDGTGICFDPNEPIHLDALIHFALMPFHRQSGNPPSRDESPEDIHLPLGKWYLQSSWGWHASALIPDGNIDTLMYWRKRFRQSMVELCRGNANIKNGAYRDYNQPMQVFLYKSLTAYALGDRRTILTLLRRHIKYLGKKRSIGLGKVVGVEVDVVKEDCSLMIKNIAQRWLPNPDGFRVVRPRPPYWNNVGRVVCCDVGDCLSF